MPIDVYQGSHIETCRYSLMPEFPGIGRIGCAPLWSRRTVMNTKIWRAAIFGLACLTGIAPDTVGPMAGPMADPAGSRSVSTGSLLPPATSGAGDLLLVQWPPPPPPPGWGGGPPPPGWRPPPPPPPPGWRPPPPPPPSGWRPPPPPPPVWGRPPPPPVWGTSSAHVRWCMNRYRSYNPRTDTYLGFDGRYHRCRSPYR